VKDHTADGMVTDMRSFSQEMGDGSLTGHVGTALYVAPELTASGSKEVYNQVRKADSFAVASHLTKSQTVSLSLRGIFCETFFSFIFYSLPQVRCILYGLTCINFSSLNLISVFLFLGIHRGVAVDSALLGCVRGQLDPDVLKAVFSSTISGSDYFVMQDHIPQQRNPHSNLLLTVLLLLLEVANGMNELVFLSANL